MSEEDRDQKLYDEYRLEVEKKKLYNNEAYDKAILTLASATLGFSILSLRLFIPSGEIEYLPILFFGWAGLVVSIAISLLSFPISNLAQVRSLEIAKSYYLDKNDAAAIMENKYGEINKHLNDFSGVLLIVSIVFIVVFSALNVEFEGYKMSEKDSSKNEVSSNLEKKRVKRGADAPSLADRKVPKKIGDDVKNSADVTELTLRPKKVNPDKKYNSDDTEKQSK